MAFFVLRAIFCVVAGAERVVVGNPILPSAHKMNAKEKSYGNNFCGVPVPVEFLQ